MKPIRAKRLILALLLISSLGMRGQELSEKMAATVMEVWKEAPAKWVYDHGVALEGIDGLWKRTGNAGYFRYLQNIMDSYVGEDGSIKGYRPDEYNIDHIKNGRALLVLYKVTGQEKYLKAIKLLRGQLDTHPRTKEGGFWHKKIYTSQMWLDGLYMGEPFYAEYSALANDQKAFDDIANQFIWMENHARDPKTGLLYHGWDESKSQQWANKTTGTSPHFWARAMGWYVLGLVDVLEYFPVNHPKRKDLLAILGRTTAAIQSVQDKTSGVWYDILNMPAAKGNYLESSASAMFVAAIAKGVRLGYLPQSSFSIAKKGFEGMKKEFVEDRAPGKINLKGTVSVSGLGGNPYRDGSFEYYMREKVITNDLKGVGAFLQACNEMELAAIPKTGKGKKVLLDSYYNNEFHKEPASGVMEPFHYVWPERDNNGFSFFGQAFDYRGATKTTLETAPTALNLKGADIYIIVDPDTDKETAKPNLMQAKEAAAVAAWVNAGGVLLLLGNDAGNAELANFNKLSDKFGIHFNEDSENHVTGSQFEMGAVNIPANNPIFTTAKKVYIKELSTFKTTAAARALLVHKGKTIIASAKYGKGTVLAVGDPWFYNEYTDGRKLPADFDNYKAANDVAKWLLAAIPAKVK